MARRYDDSFKVDAVKLAEDLGQQKAARQLNIPIATLATWTRKSKNGELRGGSPTPEASFSLLEENKRLKQELQELKRVNEILADATSFFASRQKK